MRRTPLVSRVQQKSLIWSRCAAMSLDFQTVLQASLSLLLLIYHDKHEEFHSLARSRPPRRLSPIWVFPHAASDPMRRRLRCAVAPPFRATLRSATRERLTDRKICASQTSNQRQSGANCRKLERRSQVRAGCWPCVGQVVQYVVRPSIREASRLCHHGVERAMVNV